MYYQMSLKLAETLDFPSGIMNAHTSIGKAYYNQSQYSQALAEHLQVLRMAEKLGKKEQIAVAHTNIGNVYQRQSQYEQSIQNYLVALQLRNEFRDSASAAGPGASPPAPESASACGPCSPWQAHPAAHSTSRSS